MKSQSNRICFFVFNSVYPKTNVVKFVYYEVIANSFFVFNSHLLQNII